MSEAGRVYILSGPPGAGKTTVARELASRFDRSVHLELDHFFNAIRAGFIEPWLAASEGQNQVTLAAAAAAVSEFAAGGYVVVAEGIVIPRNVPVFERRVAGSGIALVYAVLLPKFETVLRRGVPRPDREMVTEAVYRQMHRQFVAEAPAGSVIDSTRLSRAQTVEAVLALPARAVAL